ncbi:MAG: hypothetical protein V1797_17705 [Pseudomonadota bacterium]
MRTAPRLFCCAALLLGLAGCGSSEEPAPAAGPAPDPCALISQAEAAQALGQPLKAGKLHETANPLGQKICFYAGAQDAPPVRFVQISLVTSAGMQPALREQGYDAAKLYADSRALVAEPQDVPGLGQAAFFGGGGLKAGAGLHVLKGQAYLVIQVAGGPPTRQLEAAQGLAAQALARLP